MLGDVQTWWNSTHNMLEFVLKYREAINAITQKRELGLRKFELDMDEWILAQQLTDVLKVCQILVNSSDFRIVKLTTLPLSINQHPDSQRWPLLSWFDLLTFFFLDLETGHAVLLVIDAKPGHHDPSDGPHR